MTKKTPSEQELKYWQNYLITWQNYASAQMDLLCNAPSLVEMVHQGIISPHQRLASLDLARHMKFEQLRQLFSAILAVGCSNTGAGAYARQLILTFPQEWLLANIEAEAEELLSRNDELDYRGLFELYRQIDIKLARQLAERAIANPDSDIREAGEYFMEVVKQG